MLESINEEMLDSINIPDDLESQTIKNKLITQTIERYTKKNIQFCRRGRN